MKALEILKHYVHSIVPIEYSPTFVSEAIEELEEFKNRSCSNCDDFDNEMDCDEFGFCTNNENNKDFKGYDWVRTKSNFCCNNWKNKAQITNI